MWIALGSIFSTWQARSSPYLENALFFSPFHWIFGCLEEIYTNKARFQATRCRFLVVVTPLSLPLLLPPKLFPPNTFREELKFRTEEKTQVLQVTKPRKREIFAAFVRCSAPTVLSFLALLLGQHKTRLKRERGPGGEQGGKWEKYHAQVYFFSLAPFPASMLQLSLVFSASGNVTFSSVFVGRTSLFPNLPLPFPVITASTAVENANDIAPITKIGGRNFHQRNKLVNSHSFPGKKSRKCFDEPLQRNQGLKSKS